MQTFDELGLALAGATGVSNGVAALVPRLFDVERAPAVLARSYGHFQPRGTEVVDGYHCLRLEGSRAEPVEEDATVWIQQATFLIRRLEHSRVFRREALERQHEQSLAALRKSADDDPDMRELLAKIEAHSPTAHEFRSHDVHRYHPRFDVDVPPEQLTFAPLPPR